MHKPHNLACVHTNYCYPVALCTHKHKHDKPRPYTTRPKQNQTPSHSLGVSKGVGEQQNTDWYATGVVSDVARSTPRASRLLPAPPLEAGVQRVLLDTGGVQVAPLRAVPHGAMIEKSPPRMIGARFYLTRTKLLVSQATPLHEEACLVMFPSVQ